MKKVSIKSLYDFLSATAHVMKSAALLNTIKIETNSIMVRNEWQSVSMEFETGVSATVNFDKFKKLVSSLDKKQSIGFEKQEETLLIYLNDKVIMKMKNESEDEPKLFSEKYPEYHYAGLLRSKDLENVIEASAFISDDELRPAMMNVAVDSNMIYGTNGHWLYFNSHSSNISLPEITEIDVYGKATDKPEFRENCREYPIMIPQWMLKILKKSVKDYQVFIGWKIVETPISGTSKCDRKIDIMGLKLVTDGMAMTSFMCQDKYPECKSVIPNFIEKDHSEMIVEFNKNEVLEAIKICMISNSQHMEIDFNKIEGKTLFVGEDLDYQTENQMEINPISVKVNIVKNKTINCNRIGFNPVFMKAILDPLKEKTFTMKMFAPNRAAIFNEKYLLMPLMLKSYTT